MTPFLWGALTGACFASAVYAIGAFCVGCFMAARWLYGLAVRR